MQTALQDKLLKVLPFNFTVNVIDGAFFGLGMGLTSMVTVLPLFLSTLTDSTTLIGLISSIHLVGWQFPQLFMAKRVTAKPRYKPLVIWLTIQERMPFFFLALVALLVPSISPALGVLLVYLVYSWQSLGGGLTASPWQTMIGKIIPAQRHGLFYGVQAAGFSLFGAGGALMAGWLIANVPYPYNFAMCFALTGVMMTVSLVFLALTREPAHLPTVDTTAPTSMRAQAWAILREDAPYRWFLVARALMHIATMGSSFYTIYAVRRFALDAQVIGAMTSVLLITQTMVYPLFGWLGDRIGHRATFILSVLMVIAANLIALTTSDPRLLYGVFALAGAGTSGFYTCILAMTLTFGSLHQRPYYIGIGNTLMSPIVLSVPFLGGLLVDVFGFPAMFVMAIAAGLPTLAILIVNRRRTLTTEPFVPIAATD
ncbi:MAG: MFS transporter [Armatimonadetes bacterium]|nr:MFS transporter [Anaerolineae bacterium]